MGCPWYPTGNQWVPPVHSFSTRGLPMRDPWDAHGLLLILGMPMECPWNVHGMTETYPWATYGYLMGIP